MFRCLLNAHVLQHHFKLEERALEKSVMSKLRKGTGKIVQRTIGRGKKQDPFIYKDEDYAKQGIGVVINSVSWIYGYVSFKFVYWVKTVVAGYK